MNPMMVFYMLLIENEQDNVLGLNAVLSCWSFSFDQEDDKNFAETLQRKGVKFTFP